MNGVAAVWVQRLRGLTRGEGLRAQLLRGGIGSLAIKSAHTMIAFAVAVVLARSLGPEGYGVYSFALAILMLTAIPAQVGVPQLMIRETAKAQANADWGLMRGLWRWGNRSVAFFSFVALVVVGGILLLTNIGGESGRVATLTIGIGLIPLMALTNVRGACLRGLRKVVQGQLPESIIRPALLLTFASIWVVFLSPDDGLSAQQAMGFYVVAAVIAFGFGAWLLGRSRPAELSKKPTPVYAASAWRKAVVPLALITGLQLINTYADLIMLGIFWTDEEVGIYRAVFQLAFLVTFGLQAMNQVLQPHFARLHQLSEHEQLQRLVTTSARVILLLALPPVGVFVLFGGDVLAWVFGDPFRAGTLALAVLAFGQLINGAMGSVGMLLNMTGHERETVRGVALAAVANIVMNLLLVPPFGMAGAATASALTFVCWNFLLRNSVRKRLGLETLATGPLRRG